MKKLILTLFTLLVAAQNTATAETAAPDYVPAELASWTSWVLEGENRIGCPYFYTKGDPSQVCVLPGMLEINLTDTGAVFTYNVTVRGTDQTITLPGNNDYWPADVKANTKTVPVISHNGKPAVMLDEGSHTLTGVLRWQSLPSQLTVPAELALYKLTMDNKPVEDATLKNGKLWLNQKPQDSRAGPDFSSMPDTMNIQAYRYIQDGHPARVTTRLRLVITGQEREVTISPFTLANTTLSSYTGALPAKFEQNGSLRLKARAGTWDLTFNALANGKLESLTLPENMDWQREIWVFEPQPTLRLVDVKGAKQIDPSQTDLPRNWLNKATYQLTSGQGLTFETLRRGADKPADNKLYLNRTVMLDHGGRGLTATDAVTGKMNQGWRLNMPHNELLRAEIDGRLLPITLHTNDVPGIEVRHSNLNLRAVSRSNINLAPFGATKIAANAWGHRMESARMTVNAPLGWLMLGVEGADKASGTWLSMWDLYDVFLVLLITVSFGALWGVRWGALAFVALLLTFLQLEEMRYGIVTMLATAALLKVVAKSWARSALWSLHILILANLFILSWPLVLEHVRSAIYPQLAEKPFQHSANLYGGLLRHMSSDDDGAQNRRSPIRHKDMRYNKSRAPQNPNLSHQIAEESMAFPQSAQGMSSADMSMERQREQLEEIDPDSKRQTGPGVPNKGWQSISLSWQAPLQEGATVRIWMLPPTATRILNLLSAGFLVLILLRLGAANLPFSIGKIRKAVTAGALALAVLMPGQSMADDFPPQSLLNELKAKLTQRAACADACASLQEARLNVTADKLKLKLYLHAQEDVLVPLPLFNNAEWQPNTITLNGQPVEGAFIRRGHLFTLVPEGTHTVEIDGPMPRIRTAFLSFPLRAKHFEYEASGWALSGLNSKGLMRGGITLTRNQAAITENKKKADDFEPMNFPAFVSVFRTLDLGPNWTLTTRLYQSSGEPTTYEYTLREGERLLSSGYKMENGKVLVPLHKGKNVTLQSRLDVQPQLTFKASNNPRLSETWQVSSHPKWHVNFEGIPPIMYQQGGRWQPQWQPYPGEEVTLDVARPNGAPGSEITVHSAHLQTTPGERVQHSRLTTQIEVSKPLNHSVTLPEKAEVKHVSLNRRTLEVKPRNGVLTVALPVGNHKLDVAFSQTAKTGYTLGFPEVNVADRMVNVRNTMTLKRDRWVLWAQGPDWGPAVMLWSLIASMLVVAAVFGRLPYNPLKPWQWFLLALGLTQLHPMSIFLLAGWLFLLQWREQKSKNLHPLTFNFVQIGIAVLTLGSIGVIFSAVQNGLLGMPNTYIAGGGSNISQLQWYTDIAAAFPQPWVFTLPTWMFQVLMMIWSLWVAVLLLRMAKWAWGAYTADGTWRFTQPKGQNEQS